MRERMEYAAAWMALTFLRLLPRSAARWAAAHIVALLFPLRPSLRRAALFNLRLAFPDWPDAERRRVLRLMVRNIGWMAAELALLPTYTRQNIGKAIVLDGFENFAAAESRGKGVLFLTGHMSAWELTPLAHALYRKPIHFLVRPIDNPRVDALINSYRCRSGNRPIVKSKSARTMLRVLREGGVIGILADLNTAALDEAVFVDFFGIPAATTTGIARLARHTGAAVVPAYAFWDESLRKYRLRYEPEIVLTPSDDEETDIREYTARFTQAIEKYIRQFPDQWLWVHRRWRMRPAGEKPIYPDEQPNWPDEQPTRKTIQEAVRDDRT